MLSFLSSTLNHLSFFLALLFIVLACFIQGIIHQVG
jgi:hypothetical protein